MYAGPAKNGKYEESVWDVLHDMPLTVPPFTPLPRDTYPLLPQHILPDECWEVVGSQTLLDTYTAAKERHAQRTDSHRLKGHEVITLKIGDAYLTFVDVSGPHRGKSAVFDRNKCLWTNPLSSLGPENKAAACLAHGGDALQELLLKVPHAPAQHHSPTIG